MKKLTLFAKGLLLITALIAISTGSAFADIVIKNGSTMKVASGTDLVVSADVTIESGGAVDNSGRVTLRGDFTNDGTAALGSGTVVFDGTAAQSLLGSSESEFGDLTIDNSNGLSVDATATFTDLTVTGDMTMASGMFDIDDVDLTLEGNLTGHSASRYIVVGTSGNLTRYVTTVSSIPFPIGYSPANYNPVVVASPDADGYVTVNVADMLLDACNSGSEITDDVVTVRWNVSPATATEADVSLTWNATDEDGTFDNTDCSVIYCEGGGSYTAIGGFGDGSSRTITGTNITDFGTFGVGDDNFSKIYLDLSIMLQGPYAGAGSMNTTLRTANMVPTDQPYSDAKYNGSHLDYDGIESNASLPATMVDWVLLELRTGTAAATSVGTVAAMLLSDGSVVYYDDGSGSVEFSGSSFPPGDYYIAVHHRNHVSILTSAPVTLSRSSAATYDFTTGAGQFYTDGGITNAAAYENAGVYMMWGGDANFNTTVRYNGANKDLDIILIGVGVTTPGNVVTDVYSDGDVNMNNELRYNGAGKDNDVVLISVGVSTPGALVYTHVPF